MKISTPGIDLIKEFEGLGLKAYKCSANVWTIGYGHTKTAKKNMVISEFEAEMLLKQDLAPFERSVNKNVQVPLTQNQFDALVSLAFNIGTWAFETSTALKRLNEGDYKGAAEAMKWFKKYTNSLGKKVLSKGLLRRRKKEAELFLKDVDQLSPPPSNFSQDDFDSVELLLDDILLSANKIHDERLKKGLDGAVEIVRFIAEQALEDGGKR